MTDHSVRLENDQEQEFDNLVEELTDRLHAGEDISIAEYAERHPEFAERLLKLVPTLRAMADIGHSLSTVNAVSPSDNSGPQAIGDFRIVRELGRGGMGVVYEAEQLSLSRRVAMKVLPFAAVLDERQIKRFKNEALAAAQLDHPHIVNVYGVGCERAVHFYAMKYVEGHSLAEVIAQLQGASGKTKLEAVNPIGLNRLATESQNVPLEGSDERELAGHDTRPLASLSTEGQVGDLDHFRSVATIGIQIAGALDYAHQQGIIHRDIKPANIMLDASRHAWVTDFGLAHIEHGASLTMSGDLLGTLRYMSPEQALAKRVVVDHRTDIYSLGVTLYELLTLQPVFPHEDRQELLRQISFEDPIAPRRLNRNIPADLETIVLKAASKNPADRYETAQDLADDLQRYLNNEPIRARNPGVLRRFQKWSQRHRALVWSTAICCILTMSVLAASVGWIVRDRHLRQLLTSQQVEQALEEADQWQRQGDWLRVNASVSRAESLIERGLVEPSLIERVENRIADLEMLETIEHIRSTWRSIEVDDEMIRRLFLSASEDEQDQATLDILPVFDDAQVDSAYQAAFRNYGLDLETLDIDEAAVFLRERSIRDELTTALDHWALVRHLQEDNAGSQRLLAVAQASDDDELRNQLRQVFETSEPDQSALQKLAAAEIVGALPPSTLVRLAELLHAAELTDSALRVLQTGQQHYPEDYWINLRLANYLQDNRKWQEAVRFYSVAVALRPHDAEALSRLANVLNVVGNYDEALAHGRKAARLNPKSGYVHSVLGRTLQRNGDIGAAADEFREAIKQDPDYLWARYYLSDILLNSKSSRAEAASLLKEALKMDSQASVGRYEVLAEVLRKLDHPSEAIEVMQEAVSKFPSAWAHLRLGEKYYEANRPDEALVEFQTVTEMQSEPLGDWRDWFSFQAHFLTAQILRSRGRLMEAASHLEQALQRSPDTWYCYFDLAGVLCELGEWDRAVEFHHQGLQIKATHRGRYALNDEFHKHLSATQKSDPRVWQFRVQTWFDDGHWQQAAQDARRAVELEATSLKLWYELLIAEAMVGNREGWERARQRLRKAFASEDDPMIAEIMTRCCLLFPETDFDRSRMVEKARRDATRDTLKTHLTSGLAFLFNGNERAALDSLNRAVESMNNGEAIDLEFHLSGRYFLALALTHHRLGNTEEARQSFERADTYLNEKLLGARPPIRQYELLLLLSEVEEALGVQTKYFQPNALQQSAIARLFVARLWTQPVNAPFATPSEKIRSLSQSVNRLIKAHRIDSARDIYQQLVQLEPDNPLWQERMAQLTPQTQAIWNFDNSPEGWVGNPQIALAVSDGMLATENLGTDPELFQFVSAPAGWYLLKIKARSRVILPIQFYWRGSGGFNEVNSSWLTVSETNDDGQKFCFLFESPEPLKEIRIDPGNQEGQRLEFDWMTLEAVSEESIDEWSEELLTLLKQDSITGRLEKGSTPPAENSHPTLNSLPSNLSEGLNSTPEGQVHYQNSLLRARLMSRIGQFNLAAKQYQQTLDLMPAEMELWYGPPADIAMEAASNDPLYREMIQQRPNDLLLLKSRTILLAENGKWQAAAEAAQAMTDLAPNEHHGWFLLAPLRFQLGDETGYRRACDELLDRWPRPEFSMLGERSACVCLLSPTVMKDRYDEILVLADIGVAGADSYHPGYRPWPYLARALLAYRLQDYAGAQTFCKHTFAADAHCQAPGRLLYAMASHQLGEREAAREMYQEAIRLIEKNRVRFHTCEIIRREAEQTLGVNQIRQN